MNRPEDEKFMRQAIALAMRGRGKVEPNPLVGCVIARNGRVIGQGYHQRYGEAHAEPNALASCTESPAGADVYVTLEPCCHMNKKTPPCVPKLIAAKVGTVVVGCTDPNPQVNGNGIAQLRAAGIDVRTGILEPECRQLIAPFISSTVHHRPYVTLKWAQTADGKVAGPDGKRLQISNAFTSRAVHGLRNRCDAIVVGINTVLNDDPMLTARGVGESRQLFRCVLDRRLRIPLGSRLVQSARESPVIVMTSSGTFGSEKADELKKLGVEVEAADSFPEISGLLYRRQVTHALVEPGPTLAASIFRAQWADRLWVIESPKRVDDVTAPSAAEVTSEWISVGQIRVGGDRLSEYLNSRSSLFFTAAASADFLLSGSGS